MPHSGTSYAPPQIAATIQILYQRITDILDARERAPIQLSPGEDRRRKLMAFVLRYVYDEPLPWDQVAVMALAEYPGLTAAEFEEAANGLSRRYGKEAAKVASCIRRRTKS